jgi:hypothetical protein
LNHASEMDEWIYSRRRGLKGTVPCKIPLDDFQRLPVVKTYVLKLGPD